MWSPAHGGKLPACALGALMRSLVVLSSPALGENLRFSEGIEGLGVEQLVSELSVEALNVAILPKTPRLGIPRSSHPPPGTTLERLWPPSSRPSVHRSRSVAWAQPVPICCVLHDDHR